MEAWRVRKVLNAVNGSTVLGRLVAKVGGAETGRGPRGLVLATGYRLTLPRARAFTVGDVVLTRHRPGWLEARPRLLAHEERHSWQYAACLGLPMLPMYFLSAGWSLLRAGDVATRNPFERLAGLEDGGYVVSREEPRRTRSA
jgi:hypothetical protein